MCNFSPLPLDNLDVDALELLTAEDGGALNGQTINVEQILHLWDRIREIVVYEVCQLYMDVSPEFCATREAELADHSLSVFEGGDDLEALIDNMLGEILAFRADFGVREFDTLVGLFEVLATMTRETCNLLEQSIRENLDLTPGTWLGICDRLAKATSLPNADENFLAQVTRQLITDDIRDRLNAVLQEFLPHGVAMGERAFEDLLVFWSFLTSFSTNEACTMTPDMPVCQGLLTTPSSGVDLADLINGFSPWFFVKYDTSVYEILSESDGCSDDNHVEHCRCPAGQVWSGNECVEVDFCGCVHDGIYYTVGIYRSDCRNIVQACMLDVLLKVVAH